MKKQSTIHIIGAGIAGLAAAVYASKFGYKVHIYEASNYAGGRCRSYLDKKLGCEIDNGNHLLLGANKHSLALIDTVKANDLFFKIAHKIEFNDVRTGEWWDITTNKIFSKYSKIPKATFTNYIRSLPLLWANKNRTIDATLANTGVLYKRLWKPLAISMLNTPTNTASSFVFKNILFKILISGENALTCYIPKKSWNDALLDPAISYIRKNGGEFSFGSRIKSITYQKNRAHSLILANQNITLGKQDNVIIAVPSFGVNSLVNNIITPKNHHSIINVHFKKKIQTNRKLWAVVGGTAEWFFIKDDIISSTTSAADELATLSEQQIVEKIWHDAQHSLGIEDDMPPYRLLIEKRATFACTPESQRHRPDNDVGYENLVIAGDYTNTLLPATIESAVVSARNAVNIIIKSNKV